MLMWRLKISWSLGYEAGWTLRICPMGEFQNVLFAAHEPHRTKKILSGMHARRTECAQCG